MVHDDSHVDIPAWRRLKVAAAERVDADIVVITLIQQVVNAGIGPKQPFAARNINAEAKIGDGITRNFYQVGVVGVQISGIHRLQHARETVVARI